ncbi:hypothetical protein [Mycolicibacterium diernhoferi]|uniref:Alpha/beta hydrolase n=1 Tax=Mycolicibacterium diernhoferi TaxID=1801 RepID=A0A1Q4HHM5_9MYCO|nr:hypothetical protein [Mycolicibacterium diernhoferi]OJZ66891.1 hypothetical protein BRW64_06415 [Mycolicibacterium diernhoferi]OPE50527.1 hypothetical protein BV510_20855 [Mycolicibacterium diernhoferi]PEG51975.1 hypothetical protein CRI78_23895 [Mycolicibacterium diernhoferi]QYL23081.1 hypothetical protein K0O62_01580 [Mycolicibacterium diernhoferi]
MKRIVRQLGSLLIATALVAGCSSGDDQTQQQGWVEEEVSFTDSAGLTLHGTYRHQGEDAGPAALLISESGQTDRNGDNAVAGPVGNMRQLAEYLSEKGIASLRYDKVGTGKTGLGPHAQNPAAVGSAAYSAGARAAVRYLAARPGTDDSRISVYALGEGTIHAMTLADDLEPDAPRIHSLGLFQPLPGRYLDIITARVKVDVEAAVEAGAKTPEQGQTVLDAWAAAVEEARTRGTAPRQLPDGLGAILNPGNVNAVVEADAIDPLALAAKVPTGTPVLLTCSDSDGQANCASVRPLTAALKHTALTVLDLKGVNHVLRDDPTDNVANYAKPGPLSAQLTAALDTFVTK